MDLIKFVEGKEAQNRSSGNEAKANRLQAALEHLQPEKDRPNINLCAAALI
ncbi:MAG: hypothetical protein ACYDHX_04910 [Methanothrix sp.]